ncbi:hypothetical protein FQN55_009058 [Onygenales sp. PD_40]|nr:hypothetical protein FQN55_009058 [Onygenales sp. PD_40]
MDYRDQLHGSPYPQSPTDSQHSRISIGALLNPSGRSDSYPSSNPPHSPLPQDSYYYHPQSHSNHTYAQSHHHNTSHYHSNGTTSADRYAGYSEQQPRSSSANSSPGPYRRERFPSVSSSSSTVPERRRPPRPKYEEEEMYFIWYHRVDLRQEWKEVRESFNAQFPNRQRSGFQGIQCKYYRFIKEKKCPTLREQRRRRSGGNGSGNASSGSDGQRGNFNEDLPQYGVVSWTSVRFPWMREPADHRGQ